MAGGQPFIGRRRIWPRLPPRPGRNLGRPGEVRAAGSFRSGLLPHPIPSAPAKNLPLRFRAGLTGIQPGLVRDEAASASSRTVYSTRASPLGGSGCGAGTRPASQRARPRGLPIWPGVGEQLGAIGIASATPASMVIADMPAIVRPSRFESASPPRAAALAAVFCCSRARRPLCRPHAACDDAVAMTPLTVTTTGSGVATTVRARSSEIWSAAHPVEGPAQVGVGHGLVPAVDSRPLRSRRRHRAAAC